MNPQQKHARFNLVVILIAVGLVAIAFLALLPFVGPQRAQGAFGFLGILGLMGFGPVFYRKKHKEQKVVMDERDAIIGQRASLIAGVIAFEYCVLACMIPWTVLRLRDGLTQEVAISVNWLPLILFGGAIILCGTWSVAILIQYGKGTKDVEDQFEK